MHEVPAEIAGEAAGDRQPEPDARRRAARLVLAAPERIEQVPHLAALGELHPFIAVVPLSARTGVAGVDRVLTALDAQDPGGLQSLFILQKLPASDGELVDALPTLTCGNGDSIAIAPQVLPATAADLLGERIYAVFTIAPAADPWLAFSRATHAIVLSGAGGGGYPRSSMIAVNAQGIVGAGRPCGTPPTFYLRDVGTYLLPPLTTAAPASPSAGAGMVRDNTAGPDMLVIAATALAMLGGAGVWFLARRRGP